MFLFWPLLGALIGMSAARVKGLGTAAGIIGGILLGPLALLMFLCSNGKKQCEFCGEWIEKSARVCPFCTRNVRDDSTEQSSQQSIDPSPQPSGVRSPQPSGVRSPQPSGVRSPQPSGVRSPQPSEIKESNIEMTMVKIMLSKSKQKDSCNEVVKIYCPKCSQKIAFDYVD